MWSTSHTNPQGEELLITGEATIDSGFVCLPLKAMCALERGECRLSTRKKGKGGESKSMLVNFT